MGDGGADSKGDEIKESPMLTKYQEYDQVSFQQLKYQSLISGKWAVLIMHYLEDSPIRFNDLLRLMPKMTHATLSVQLKALADNGLVERKQYDSILQQFLR